MRPFGRPPGTAYSYFNPRIPQGMRPNRGVFMTRFTDFNPRIPQGMRHGDADGVAKAMQFQSTHSAGNATPQATYNVTPESISIHAFRRECDYDRSGDDCI